MSGHAPLSRAGLPDEAGFAALFRLYATPLLVALVILFCDLFTKDLAATLLQGRGPLELGLGLRLLHRSNPGIMLGALGGLRAGVRQPLVLGLGGAALLALPGLVGWLVPQPRLRAWAVALIAAGALGNFLSRLWVAQVVDFLQVGPRSWRLPAFNLADLSILVGAALVIAAVLSARRRTARAPWSSVASTDPEDGGLGHVQRAAVLPAQRTRR